MFRGLAALAVVTHHATLSTTAFVGAIPEPFATWLGMGLLGVDFFFVLSGFIIMHAHMDDARTPTAVKRYTLKRLARIYPAYLPVGVVMIVLYLALPGLSAAGEMRDYSLFSSLLLLPADGPPALSVAWTLVHELMFYAVFLLFFLSRRWLVAGLLAWAVVIFVANYFYTPTGWLRYPLSVLNIEFMLGVGAAWLVQSRVDGSGGKWIAGVGLVIAFVAVLFLMQDAAGYLRLLLAFGLALLVVGFALHEQQVAARWPALLLVLGNASYSIYLIHNPLLSITQRLAGRIGLTWPLAMVWGVVLSVLAGWMYYRIVERPALQFFQQRLRRQ
jgi:exopolysaccharide production protein ExoZ